MWALVLGALFIFSDAAEANLLVNGSFEEDGGAFTEGQPILAAGSTVITGWVVTQENIDYVISGNGSFVAAEGERSVDLDGTPGFGGIAQTFATIPGLDYLVTFALAGNPFRYDPAEPNVKLMRVMAAGASADFSFDTTGKDGGNPGWTTESWIFTAVETSTTLEFLSRDTAEEGYSGLFGPALDNVIVTAVPEPSTILLVAAGLTAFAKGRRRSR